MLWTYLTVSLFWDVLILLLIGGGVILVWLANRSVGWLLWQRLLLGTCGVLISLTVFYGSFIEPQLITITEAEVKLPTASDLTIVVLSDLHVGPYKGERFVRRLVDKVNAISPDFVLLAGDFIYHGADPADRLSPLENLHTRYGVFGVLGNHEYNCIPHKGGGRTFYGTFDGSQVVRRALERSGVKVLSNAFAEVVLEQGGPLFIAGVDDECSGHNDLESALPDTTQKSSLILIAHDPSVILQNQSSYANLIVAGHTHGGQIRLPIIGPVPSLPTELSRSYDQGIFAIDQNTTLAITRGVGETGPRARLFAPPEILVLRVR
ncbi:MAG TPA: metallophosphoesterase [Candidatus Peribacterales bacterium]|nr:metallophosphoesterase [Candidatus Peribacterales bacterium]